MDEPHGSDPRGVKGKSLAAWRRWQFGHLDPFARGLLVALGCDTDNHEVYAMALAVSEAALAIVATGQHLASIDAHLQAIVKGLSSR